MKNLKYLGLLFITSYLAAQDFEINVFHGQQNFLSASGSSTDGSRVFVFNPENNNFIKYRIGRKIFEINDFSFQFNISLQQKNKTAIFIKDWYPESGMLGEGEIEIWNYSIGSLIFIEKFFKFGFGIEYKFENYNLNGKTTKYSRPWAILNSAYIWKSGKVQPFLGVEYSLPLMSVSSNINSNRDEIIKSIAPKNNYGIYVGIKF